MKIGIISDTHGLLRPEVLEALRGSDAILHGGDINRQEIIDRLETIAPVYVVRGNNDKEWAGHIPYFLDFELAGIRICMSHKKKDLPADLSEYALAVFGHTHMYEESRLGKTLLLNPGSCGPRRFHKAITLAIADLSDGTKGEKPGDNIKVTRVDILQKPPTVLSKSGSADLKRQIEIVIRETQRAKSPSEIAVKNGLDARLTEQIARLYLTHPGVTADGIMTKMGY